MPATLEPPASAAPPAGVTIVGGGSPPKPPPAPTRTIRVSEMTSPGGTPATDKGPPQPVKTGSALDRLNSDLRKKAGVAEETPQSPPPKPETETEVTPPETEEAPPTTEQTPPKPQTDKPAAIDPKTGKPAKPNPWKLVDEYKSRATQLEKDLVEAKKQVLPEQDRKSYNERVTKAEARVKELEDEIRFVNYEKHPDFIRDHQQPYDRAWQLATAELNEISVVDPQTNQPRAATPQDLMELVQLPLGQAREVAEQMFGKFANDVMQHRKEIKTLFEKKTQALKDAREQGGLREKQMREQFERQSGEMQHNIASTWESANKSALEDPKFGSYFKPREGDQDWNQRLGKGFQMVDQAYSENPTDPKLTPEQRAAAVKRHVAIRNRAASWGAVRFDNERKDARIAELEKELAEFKQSIPSPTGDERSTEAEPGQGSAMNRVVQDLRKLATKT